MSSPLPPSQIALEGNFEFKFPHLFHPDFLGKKKAE